MDYLDVLQQTKPNIEKAFKALADDWRVSFTPEIGFAFSSSFLINEHQLLDTSLTVSDPNLEETIDLSISFFQHYLSENARREFSSKVEIDKTGDLVNGEKIYVVSDICDGEGALLYENEVGSIAATTTEVFRDEMSHQVELIFETFRRQKQFVIRKLEQAKNCR